MPDDDQYQEIPDVSELLAEIGLDPRAIREVLDSPAGG